MLGKLIKHEWLSTWKVPTILCIYLGVLTILGCISFLSPMWQTDSLVIEIIAMLSVLLYILSLFAISITVFVYFIVRFYRNMYTNEGYLTHTLPVKPWEHIFSKGLIFFIWMLITVIAMTVSIALLIITAISSINGDAIYIVRQAMQTEVIPELNTFFQTMLGMTLGGYIAFLVATTLVSAIYSILMIYASISVGQLFNKHKVFASFVAYAVINFIVQIIGTLVLLPLYRAVIEEAVTSNYISSNFFTQTIGIGVGSSALLAVVFAFVTEYITRKKLNLD